MRGNTPKNEVRRLAALRSYQMLDTEPEQGFDDLALLASRICETPIGLVSLVDQDRLWFKARVGLELTEIPRDVAFCAHAILDDQVLVVSDARDDPCFADNPLVRGASQVRFYAGAPLIDGSGFRLGTVCVVDTSPREISDDQVQALRALARQASVQMDVRRVAAELASTLASMEVLQSLLPICSWCKNIRDDEGYWQRVEDYLEQHAGVDLTHGICPCCERKVVA